MTLHQLKIVTAIGKRLNITKAANDLHTSQPAASQQIKLLEEEFGVKLHRKTNRGVEITKEGLGFLDRAEQILLQVDNLEKDYKKSSNSTGAGTFRLGSCHSPLVSFLPPVLVAFNKDHPDVQVSLESGTSKVLERLVLNSEVELGLINNPSYFPAMVYEFCREEKIVAVVSAYHPLAKRRELTIAELANTPLVVKKGKESPGGIEQWLKKLRERGVEITIGMYCETVEATKCAIKAGLGVGIIYRDVVKDEIKRGELKTIKIKGLDWKVATLVTYRKDCILSSKAKDFLTYLRGEHPKTSSAKFTLKGNKLEPNRPKFPANHLRGESVNQSSKN